MSFASKPRSFLARVWTRRVFLMLCCLSLWTTIVAAQDDMIDSILDAEEEDAPQIFYAALSKRSNGKGGAQIMMRVAEAPKIVTVTAEPAYVTLDSVVELPGNIITETHTISKDDEVEFTLFPPLITPDPPEPITVVETVMSTVVVDVMNTNTDIITVTESLPATETIEATITVDDLIGTMELVANFHFLGAPTSQQATATHFKNSLCKKFKDTCVERCAAESYAPMRDNLCFKANLSLFYSYVCRCGQGTSIVTSSEYNDSGDNDQSRQFSDDTFILAIEANTAANLGPDGNLW